MYQVDKKEILSVRLVEATVDSDWEYREEVKQFLRPNIPSGMYRGYTLFEPSEYNTKVGDTVFTNPHVQVRFKSQHHFTEYFYFVEHKDALKLFNELTTPDQTLKR